jgi:hypothetical protein
MNALYTRIKVKNWKETNYGSPMDALPNAIQIMEDENHVASVWFVENMLGFIEQLFV